MLGLNLNIMRCQKTILLIDKKDVIMITSTKTKLMGMKENMKKIDGEEELEQTLIYLLLTQVDKENQ